MHTKEGGDEDQEGAEVYREAVKRGCKRLAYISAKEEAGVQVSDLEETQGKMPNGGGEEALDIKEEERVPLSKKKRFQGPMVEGWEKVTPEKNQGR